MRRRRGDWWRERDSLGSGRRVQGISSLESREVKLIRDTSYRYEDTLDRPSEKHTRGLSAVTDTREAIEEFCRLGGNMRKQRFLTDYDEPSQPMHNPPSHETCSPRVLACLILTRAPSMSKHQDGQLPIAPHSVSSAIELHGGRVEAVASLNKVLRASPNLRNGVQTYT